MVTELLGSRVLATYSAIPAMARSSSSMLLSSWAWRTGIAKKKATAISLGADRQALGIMALNAESVGQAFSVKVIFPPQAAQT